MLKSIYVGWYELFYWFLKYFSLWSLHCPHLSYLPDMIFQRIKVAENQYPYNFFLTFEDKKKTLDATYRTVRRMIYYFDFLSSQCHDKTNFGKQMVEYQSELVSLRFSKGTTWPIVSKKTGDRLFGSVLSVNNFYWTWFTLKHSQPWHMSCLTLTHVHPNTFEY